MFFRWSNVSGKKSCCFSAKWLTEKNVFSRYGGQHKNPSFHFFLSQIAKIGNFLRKKKNTIPLIYLLYFYEGFCFQEYRFQCFGINLLSI